jgi:HPt (histidine-containing phosphotransfer) domain-containing protein
MAGDPDMLDLVEMFVADMPERAQTLEETFQHNELIELRRLAHQLRGASAGYGFEPIGNAAGVVELAAQDALAGKLAIESIRAQVEQLIDLCKRVSM